MDSLKCKFYQVTLLLKSFTQLFGMIYCSPHDRPSASIYSLFLLLLSFTMVFSPTALLGVPRMHQALSCLHGLTHVSVYLESSLGYLLFALLFKRELSSLLGSLY